MLSGLTCCPQQCLALLIAKTAPLHVVPILIMLDGSDDLEDRDSKSEAKKIVKKAQNHRETDEENC